MWPQGVKGGAGSLWEDGIRIECMSMVPKIRDFGERMNSRWSGDRPLSSRGWTARYERSRAATLVDRGRESATMHPDSPSTMGGRKRVRSPRLQSTTTSRYVSTFCSPNRLSAEYPHMESRVYASSRTNLLGVKPLAIGRTKDRLPNQTSGIYD